MGKGFRPSFTACPLRFAIQGFACFHNSLEDTGSPSVLGGIRILLRVFQPRRLFVMHGVSSPAMSVGLKIMSLLAVALAGMPAGWGSDNAFVYFLDGDAATVAQDIATLSQAGQVYSNYAVIGDISAAQRSGLTTSGPRAVGKTAEIGGGNSITWAAISSLFNAATPPDVSTFSARQTLAGQILSGVQIDWQDADAFPQAAEAQPTPAGGYGFWAQDIENVGSQSGPDEAAAYLALMWAGRVVLGNSMKIIPVPASGIQKRTAADWNLPSVLGGVAGGDNYLSALGLTTTLAPADQQHLGSIDLLSAMHLLTVEDAAGTPAPLIDGFLAQQYSADGTAVNPGALPGSFSDDMFYPQDSSGDPTPTSRLLFYDGTMPYAMLSSDSLQLGPIGQPTPPWTSYFDGSLPFHAGVYWDAAVEASLDPRLYLDPVQRSLADQLPSNGVALPEPSMLAAVGAVWALAAARSRRR
jgi:hypothetical protein